MVNGEWPLTRARKLAERIHSVEEAWQFALGRATDRKRSGDGNGIPQETD
jgi:hypothetical protein